MGCAGHKLSICTNRCRNVEPSTRLKYCVWRQRRHRAVTAQTQTSLQFSCSVCLRGTSCCSHIVYYSVSDNHPKSRRASYDFRSAIKVLLYSQQSCAEVTIDTAVPSALEQTSVCLAHPVTFGAVGPACRRRLTLTSTASRAGTSVITLHVGGYNEYTSVKLDQSAHRCVAHVRCSILAIYVNILYFTSLTREYRSPSQPVSQPLAMLAVTLSACLRLAADASCALVVGEGDLLRKGVTWVMRSPLGAAACANWPGGPTSFCALCVTVPLRRRFALRKCCLRRRSSRGCEPQPTPQHGCPMRDV
jgi:hypothetical protein